MENDKKIPKAVIENETEKEIEKKLETNTRKPKVKKYVDSTGKVWDDVTEFYLGV